MKNVLLIYLKHPEWDASGSGFPNDVALLRLIQNVAMNEFVAPISLAPAEATNDDYSECVITGWGAVRMSMNHF